MITWTGTHLVYGSRPHGFLSLHPDGSLQQITEFGYPGRIARNGERILRFQKCGPDETGTGYWITPHVGVVGRRSLSGFFLHEFRAAAGCGGRTALG